MMERRKELLMVLLPGWRFTMGRVRFVLPGRNGAVRFVGGGDGRG